MDHGYRYCGNKMKGFRFTWGEDLKLVLFLENQSQPAEKMEIKDIKYFYVSLYNSAVLCWNDTTYCRVRVTVQWTICELFYSVSDLSACLSTITTPLCAATCYNAAKRCPRKNATIAQNRHFPVWVTGVTFPLQKSNRIRAISGNKGCSKNNGIILSDFKGKWNIGIVPFRLRHSL